MEHSPKYYIVEAAALPEIFQKVAEAKRHPVRDINYFCQLRRKYTDD